MLLTRLPIRRTIGLLQLYKDLLFSFLFIYDRERMPFSFQTRAKLCYEERISVREVFDFKTGETSENSSSANSIPPEFLLPPFLAACGHFFGTISCLSLGNVETAGYHISYNSMIYRNKQIRRNGRHKRSHKRISTRIVCPEFQDKSIRDC